MMSDVINRNGYAEAANLFVVNDADPIPLGLIAYIVEGQHLWLQG